MPKPIKFSYEKKEPFRDAFYVIIVCEGTNPHWQVTQSNPCFEVWLYFHAKVQLPELNDITKCKYWKPFLPTIIQGGFNSDSHPISIETAIANAKATCQETGYLPAPGSTQVWRIGEELLTFIKKDLDKLKPVFSAPTVIE